MNCKIGAILVTLGSVASPFYALASDIAPSAIAYQHYRCDALAHMNRMTDADRLVCDKLYADVGFDLAVWEANNRAASIKLHEDVLFEFF